MDCDHGSTNSGAHPLSSSAVDTDPYTKGQHKNGKEYIQVIIIGPTIIVCSIIARMEGAVLVVSTVGVVITVRIGLTFRGEVIIFVIIITHTSVEGPAMAPVVIIFTLKIGITTLTMGPRVIEHAFGQDLFVTK
jgi:hypothetical protein